MMKLWKCSVCGFVYEGESGPEKCPKCGAPKESFTMLSAEESNKIYMSVRTNDIHIKIAALSAKIIALCEEGIEINLDPPCVADFTNTKNDCWIIKQRAIAEMGNHMKKGKW